MMIPPLNELIPSINALIDWMSKLLVGSSNSNRCGAYVCNHFKKLKKKKKWQCAIYKYNNAKKCLYLATLPVLQDVQKLPALSDLNYSEKFKIINFQILQYDINDTM